MPLEIATDEFKLMGKFLIILGQPSIEFLSCEINSRGVRLSTKKVEAIRRIEIPRSVKELQRFLGVIKFYHRFIPHMAETSRILYDHLTLVLRQKRKISNKFLRPDSCRVAFDMLKEKLA